MHHKIFFRSLLFTLLLVINLSEVALQRVPGISMDDARRLLIGNLQIQSRFGCSQIGEYCATSDGCCSLKCNSFANKCVS